MENYSQSLGGATYAQDQADEEMEPLEGDKRCPMNNCGNPIADDEETCGDHKGLIV